MHNFESMILCGLALVSMLWWCVCGGAAACVVKPVCIASNSIPHPRAPLLPHVHRYVLPSIKELLSIPSLIPLLHPPLSTFLPPFPLAWANRQSSPLVLLSTRKRGNFCWFSDVWKWHELCVPPPIHSIHPTLMHPPTLPPSCSSTVSAAV